MSIPYINVGGDGPLFHFSHANGYPPLTYRALLDPFRVDHEVIASLHRPTWDTPPEPSGMKSWVPLGEDLLLMLKRLGQSNISVGHSMGAAAIVMAAVKHPELFRTIVLIEPVIMSRKYFYFLKLFRGLAKRKIPLIRKTLDRTESWATREEAYEHFRPKLVFKNVSDAVLWDYVNYGTAKCEDGTVRLVYSKEWEAHCYLVAHSIWSLLPKVKVPLLAIRGRDSNTLSEKSWIKWKEMSPQHDYREIANAGHLVPMEQPEQIVVTIREWSAKNK